MQSKGLFHKIVEYFLRYPSRTKVYCDVVEWYSGWLHLFQLLDIAFKCRVCCSCGLCLLQFGYYIATEVFIACYITVCGIRLLENKVTTLLKPVCAQRLFDILATDFTIFRQ